MLSALLYQCIVKPEFRSEIGAHTRLKVIQDLHAKIGATVSEPFLKIPSLYLTSGLEDILQLYRQDLSFVREYTAFLGSRRAKRLREAADWIEALIQRRAKDENRRRNPKRY